MVQMSPPPLAIARSQFGGIYTLPGKPTFKDALWEASMAAYQNTMAKLSVPPGDAPFQIITGEGVAPKGIPTYTITYNA